jgi:parallel beta-helix repeat protein
MLNYLATLLVSLAQPEAGMMLTVIRDDTKITQSCTVTLVPGLVIEDANGDGVLHIMADDITVSFGPAQILRGAAPEVAPDQYKGIGIRVDGRKNVKIRGTTVSGYKIGICASDCDGLTIDGADFSDNYRQHLKSTVKAEDGSDWLFPHHNDNDEWITQHGAALSIRNARGVTVNDVRVRSGQNGIILDRVTDSSVFDNDCSFLSGWGIAMWRSSRNHITRNALDFCVRGYSHGVYNRGQDSAGLLMFEQCDENVIAHNSITHGGDGIFGFAGREAIGEAEPLTADFDYKGRGNRANIIAHNDLSYAPAHGLEMTFSHGNIVLDNRFVENAICGIWGGYSQGFVISGNLFENNGEMSYGLERGGINIEHGSGNRIVRNEFKGNKCGVHLWWDNDAGLLEKAGVRNNYRGVSENVVAGNVFRGDKVALHLRDGSEKKDQVRRTMFAANTLQGVEQEIVKDEGIAVTAAGEAPTFEAPEYKVFGNKKPVDARQSLRGRQNIIMTEWGPWDHAGPLVRLAEDRGEAHVYEAFNIDPADVSVSGVGLNVEQEPPTDGRPLRLTIKAAANGVAAYRLHIRQPGYAREIPGSLLRTQWDVVVFPWKGDGGPNPPVDLEAWRASAAKSGAVRASTDRLSFQFGGRGPSNVGISPEITGAQFSGDWFGIVATSKVPLPHGRWRVRTLSDDGVRVLADGKPLIENWTHHGATRDEAILELDADRTVDLTVEYFEIFGGAVLEVEIAPANE